MKKLLFLYLILLSFHGISFAQKQGQELLDSLLSELPKATADTNKVNTLNSLSKEFKNTGDYDKAKQYATDALSFSQQIKFKKGQVESYNSIGRVCEEQGNYPEALKNHFAALKIAEEAGDKKGISASSNDIGNVYNDQGNYSDALNNYQVSLTIRKEIGDKKGIAASYNNIGLIYEDLGNFPEALKNHFASLKIKEEIGYKLGIAASYNNIGLIYAKQDNFPEALKNQLASLKIEEEIGHKNGIIDSYNNIGVIYGQMDNYAEALKYYSDALKLSAAIGYKYGIADSYNHLGSTYSNQGNYPEALKNCFAALKTFEEIGFKDGIVNCYNNLGEISIKLKKYQDAKKYIDEAIALSSELENKHHLKTNYYTLSKLDSATGNWESAYQHHKLYMLYRDSLVNEENTKKTVQVQMQYDFDKKEATAKAEQDKKDIVQRNIRNSIAGGLAGALVFLVIVFRQRNKVKKEKLKAEKEKKKSEELLLNILPTEVAEELKTTGAAKAKAFTMVTVMFTDFKDFTSVSEKVSAELLVDEIHHCFSAFDLIIQKYKIEKIKTIGDAYLCASGLPISNYTHAVDMLNAAFEIRDFMLVRKKEKEAKGEIPFELRIGIHTGPVVAGIVGVKKYAYDIWGDTVNIAARMEQNSDAGKINISGSTYELVKDKFKCEHRGKIEAKNKGMIDMYFVLYNIADSTSDNRMIIANT